RPYTLVPLTAERMPEVSYYNAQGQKLAEPFQPNQVAYTVYDIFIHPGIFYQPHPAFAPDAQKANLGNIHTLADFKKTGARELIADDYVYEIKRLADPTVQSPIYGFMSQHIVGLAALAGQLQGKSGYIDLRQYSLEGATVIDRYHYQIKIKGFYPQ